MEGLARIPSRVPAVWKSLAEEPVVRLRRMLGTVADDRQIEAWVRRWATSAARAPNGSREEWRRGVASILLAVRSCPAPCFTAASAEVAAQRWKWWPAGAEAYALCEEVARPNRDQLAALEAVLAAPIATGPGREAAPEPPREKSREEVEAVRAAAAAFQREVEARIAAERARRPLAAASRRSS